MQKLRLKNTYTRKIETFEPLDATGRRVSLYSCGPTVYSFAHIGNFRSFLLADLLRRVLELNGYEVRHVMNITDVGHMTEDHLADATGEDKLSRAARELGSDPFAVARHFERIFVEDARSLRLKNYASPDGDEAKLHPQATRYVAEMLVMIQQLLDHDYAYMDGTGQVYFEIAKFEEYGHLSGKELESLEAGARVTVREEKRDPRDFALWKVDDKHLMKWDPHGPAGWQSEDYERFRSLAPSGVDARIRPGFPGWHIECSAMCTSCLGPSIDVHTGGEDNVFPHHECEIAQSYGAQRTGTPAPEGAADAGSIRKSFARFWVHGRHLLVNDRKMSKRDGTFFTVRDLLDPAANGRPDLIEPLEKAGFPGGKVLPNVLRYALLSNQYTQPMNFTFDLLMQSRASVERLQSLHDRLRGTAAEAPGAGETSSAVREIVAAHEAEFLAALNDNLNMPVALASVFALCNAMNKQELTPGDAALALQAVRRFDSVLDVLAQEARSGTLARDRIEDLSRSNLPSYEQLSSSAVTDSTTVENLVALRHAARRDKDFAKADAIRKELGRRGVLLEDTPQGVRWKIS